MIELPSNDFRVPAVAVSQAKVMNGRGDPVEGRWSCCLPAPHDGGAVRARANRVVLITFIIMCVGVVIGGLIALWLKLGTSSLSAIPVGSLAIAGAFSFTGFAVGIGGMVYKRRLIRRHLHDRVAAGRSHGPDRPVAVTIENLFTVQTLKVNSEDSGILVTHPDLGCLRLEGITCRYIIHVKDVVRVLRVKGPNSEAIGIHYAIENVTLALALQPMGIGGEVWRQIFRRKSSLVRVVCRGLGKTEAELGL